MPLLTHILFTLINNVAIGTEVRINSVDEFIQFKVNVNNGTNYLGTTVFLDSDMNLDGKTFEPIGTSYYWTYFYGVFDGQGHIFSNLAMTSYSKYVGIFGYSFGLTIKNVILDSSCSISCLFSDYSWACVGGIIGSCEADNSPCIIENSVNMASISFTGNVKGDNSLYLGGITGSLSYSSNYMSIAKNCVNYGDVTHSGGGGYSHIGGIVGKSLGSSLSKKVYVQNSLNYGAITHNGTTTYALYLGGIAGFSSTYSTVENCVSAGKILFNKASCVGSIAGHVDSYTTLNHCYASSELSSYKKYEWGIPSSESNVLSYDNTTFELNEAVFVGSYTGTSLVNALNAAADYYALRDYSHWLLNKDRNTVKFTINNDRTSSIEMDYQIILLPSLASEGNIGFNRWYEDSTLTKPLTSYEVTSDKSLYGKWGENTNSYTIIFDTRREGVTVPHITAQFGSVVDLPSDSIKDRCSVGFWERQTR